MFQFNAKEYHEYLQSQPLPYLLIGAAWGEKINGLITAEQYEMYVEYINSSYTKPHVSKYLRTVKNRATPDACKQAKKGLQAYCEYLIFKDKESGLISPEMAKDAKKMLLHFLTQNKTIDKQA